MLSLQHQSSPKEAGDGVREAFRFTCREPGKSSFVSGLALSSRRVSWRSSRVIGGYVSGPALTFESFEDEIYTHYSYLCGCAQWRFAVLHPTTFAPLCRSGSEDFTREYVVVVDEKPVAIRLFYDWGCWCYLIYSVRDLSADESDLSATADAAFPAADDEGGRKRGRGGSL
jgi:hypothetical protein